MVDSEPLNIWNEHGCNLPDNGDPNRGICTACCYFFEIIQLDKPQNQCCNHQDLKNGCLVHTSKPRECANFHCSQVSNNMKVGLINAAKKLRIVTDEEAEKAKSLWLTS